MQFNTIFIATALLASASSAMSAKLTAFEGADCTGKVIDVDANAQPGGCIFLTQHGSAKSIGYSGVPHQIKFWKSGGPNDKCHGNPSVVKGGGSGCATAPAGVNLESVRFS
ncbi:Membrane metallo-endopeptidase-like 1 [Mycena venus]|uniref:Membrane metallo-endopeptidase-like 1 n=1 Tax=Mycena venus TaxID=2733690 RepID=A0A8H6XUU6_9AGAR|nr:Membrane metallo-endopeptidase-like 1 [Mycena venus]